MTVGVMEESSVWSTISIYNKSCRAAWSAKMSAYVIMLFPFNHTSTPDLSTLSLHTLLPLYSSSTPALPILYPYSTHTLPLLYSYSTPTLPILYPYSTHTLPLLYTYTTHTRTLLTH